MSIAELLKTSYTAFHAVENAEKILKKSGFAKIPRGEQFSLKEGGKYYLVDRESALVAFTVGNVAEKNFYYKFVCSHADSPCFKIKHCAENLSGKYSRLEVESYGGGIWYSWFDRKLRLAGRLIVRKGEKVYARLCVSEENFVIPSLAVHMNREVNKNFAVNVQTDTQPLFALSSAVGGLNALMKKFLAEGEELVDYDLYLVSAEEPFVSGAHGEFLTAARVDNLACAFSSVEALANTKPGDGINVCAVFDKPRQEIVLFVERAKRTSTPRSNARLPYPRITRTPRIPTRRSFRLSTRFTSGTASSSNTTQTEITRRTGLPQGFSKRCSIKTISATPTSICDRICLAAVRWERSVSAKSPSIRSTSASRSSPCIPRRKLSRLKIMTK